MTTNNPIPSLEDFQNLVEAATRWLNNDAKHKETYYLGRNAQLLEDDVYRALTLAAEGTAFAGTIEKISGQRFPDIVVARRYGVEVKSAKDDHWINLGGSINESTRVESVEYIALVFGKLTNPVKFRCRPYEDCLSDVVVTHYPRYKIDMNLPQNATIFAKMHTSYDALRESDNPVGRIVGYYKSQLGEGESLWWTGDANQDEAMDEPGFLKIKLFNTLPAEEKCDIRNMGLALFPEMLGSSNKKYGRFVLWLAANRRVVSASTRDIYTAGGRTVITAGGKQFTDVPQIMVRIRENKAAIVKHIAAADKSLLQETWRTDTIKRNRLGQWIDLAANHCTIKEPNAKEILNHIFDRY